jgi:hypothetical protein
MLTWVLDDEDDARAARRYTGRCLRMLRGIADAIGPARAALAKARGQCYWPSNTSTRRCSHSLASFPNMAAGGQ